MELFHTSKILLFIVLWGVIGLGNVFAECPNGDLDDDCYVGITDLAIFAVQWLDPAACVDHPDDCGDLVGNDGVNIRDFAVIATNWMGSKPVGGCPKGDLDNDCYVGIADLAIFGVQWLDPGGCIDHPDDCGDLLGNDGVNIQDFTVIASNWRSRGNPLFINEFMASNNTTLADDEGGFDDWIEIYNDGDMPIDVGGMYLTDDLANPSKWMIPVDSPGLTTIAGKGYLLIWADDEAGTGLHAPFKLGAGGEKIGLYDTDGNGRELIDSVTFGEQKSDISFGRYPDGTNDLRFFGTPTPLAANNGAYIDEVADTRFNYKRGFYTDPINVSITCDTPGATIYYTLDSRDPSESSTLYVGAIPINSTTCVRARAYKAGWLETDIDTQTYLFISDIINQSPNGETPSLEWPTGSVNGQVLDYGMDPDIVNATRYRDVIDDALLDIPTISLVSDRDNLFDKFIGIYVNALQDGIAWERPASMELINPDGSEGFQINAGLRIRGGYSRDRNNPKHAFRVFFRSEYGDSKLNYPLFGKEGVDEFEKVDLRTAQNYSWSFNSWQGYNNTMAREVFSRDLQREMGQPYTRSRYYHLYLNGQYWGVFQTQERSEARFAKSYLGGEVEDYDVVKAAWTHVEATDGSTLAYNDFWALANSGFSSNNAYKQAQGLNPDGTGNPAYPKYLDVDNLIDYMTCVYYAGDFDSPISWFGGNDYINNFYAIYNRNNPDGWKFFRHDGEHTLLAYDMNFSQSIDRTGPYSVGSSVNQFNPQWLHQQLTGNQDYLIRFADRVHKHFANGGILTPANASDLFMSRANQIDMAIIAESARWGDSKVPAPRHRHKDWVPAINAVVDNFFPTRTNLVLNQLKSKGWYPSIDPPVFYINGSYNKHGGYISAGDNLSMINPNGSGNLYYTLDGEDPRVSVAGSVAPTAIRYIGENITLNESTQVKARLLDGGEWTALNDATYGIGPTAESLRISEIMYNPVGDPNSEFIELENIGAVPINLKLASFTDGIDFTFGSHILASGNYVVVVRNLSAFNTAYPNYTGTIAGVYSGSLDNGGETIKLEDAVGSSILDFRYKDGWYDITDGGGFSLTLLDSSNADLDSWSEKASWTSSTVLGGTPGQADTGQKPGDIVINEVLAHSDTVAYDWIELHNTTSNPIDIGGWFLSDSGSDDPNLMKYEIALGETIAPYGYKVYYENLHFGSTSTDPGRRIPFALSENGEMVYLSSADGGVLSGYREAEDFGASLGDVSMGRYIKSAASGYDVDFVAMSSRTAGSANSTPKVGPIVISEIMYNPLNPDNDAEYVELVNVSGSAVTLLDLATNEPWKFVDDYKDKTPGIDYEFPTTTPTTMAAGERILLVKNLTAFNAKFSAPGVTILEWGVGNISDSGERLQLSMPGDIDNTGERQYIRVDRVNFGDGSHPEDYPDLPGDPWPTNPDGLGDSLDRISESSYGNDVANWQGGTPSPGS